MAVETKIGLVVGLAFIVCFGVILSHRGGGDRTSADVAMEFLNRHRQADEANRSSEPRHARPERSGKRTISALPPSADDLQQAAQRRDRARASSQNNPTALEQRPTSRRRTPPRQGNLSMRRNNRQANRSAPVPTQDRASSALRPTQSANTTGGARDDQRTSAAREKASAAPTGKAPTYESLFGRSNEKEAAAKQPVERALPKTSPKQRLRRGTTRERDLKPTEKAATYAVASGDTLWRIARKVYGQADRAGVEAIFAANRDQLPSADKLSVGMKLVVPARNAAAATSRATQPARQAKASKPKSSGPTAGDSSMPVRFYQVQVGDRYTLIAERLLGDKARWTEIYELNKDIFPDAGRIRPGVRIRIPSTALADARGRRR